MAHLSGTQKKTRNKFIALLVAILVVAAAIFYVVYSDFMSKSSLIENQDFATALGVVHDKAVRKISADDLASSKLLVVNSTGNNEEYIVLNGGDDAVAEYAAWLEQSKASMEDETVEVTADVGKYAAFSVFETEELNANDFKHFANAEVVDIKGTAITDPALISNFKNLKYGDFSSCGLTDLSGFASLDLAKVESLNLSGNSITDWTVLEPIAEKVITFAGYTLVPAEDGNYGIAYSETTLAEQMEQEAAAEEAEGEETTEEAPAEETVEETVEETTEAPVEETPVEEVTEENAEAETAEVTE